MVIEKINQMFRMTPEMKFKRRLALWWSVVWRTQLASYAMVLGVFLLSLIVIAVLPKSPRDSILLWLSSLSLPKKMILVGISLACTVLFSPVTGYLIRKGFDAHQLTTLKSLTLKRAAWLGLVTVGWGLVFSMPQDIWILLSHTSLKHMHTSWFGNLLHLLIYSLFSFYIVLPRQARRLYSFE